MPTTNRFLKITSLVTNDSLQVVLRISRCTQTFFSTGEQVSTEIQGEEIPLTIKKQFDVMRYFDVKNVVALVGQQVPDCYDALSPEYAFLAYVYNAQRVWVHAANSCIDPGPAFDLTVSFRSPEKERNLSWFDRLAESAARGFSNWLGIYQTGHVVISARRAYELAQIAGARDASYLQGSSYTLSYVRYFVNPVEALASVI